MASAISAALGRGGSEAGTAAAAAAANSAEDGCCCCLDTCLEKNCFLMGPFRSQRSMVIEVTEFNSEARGDLRGCLEAAMASEATKMAVKRQYAHRYQGN